MTTTPDIAHLLDIMRRLRTPGTGCPWDLEQTFATIAPYTIEEAYEVADAIERRDLDDLRDELGDLLLQVVFHARMAEECGAFAFGDVVAAICAKMVRRHPHVFGDGAADGPGAVRLRWEEIKAAEKAARRTQRQAGGNAAAPGLLDDVPVALPALARAVKLQQRAGTVGFDWNDVGAVVDKIEEELAEFQREQDAVPADPARLGDELGDILFAVANLARHVGVDPEAALRRSNAKFTRRFGHIETALAERGRSPGDATLEEMEALWQAAKRQERP